MPSTLFDSAGLAIVAYAQVDGATGSSTSTGLANSGVYSTRTATGVYDVYLPTALAQDPSRDLIFVQPKITAALQQTNGPAVADVLELSPGVKEVKMFAAGISPFVTTAVDADFDVLVLRTILP